MGELTNYWLCVTNSENWAVIKKTSIWGVPEKRGRHQLEKVELGDYLVFYVSPKRLAGVFRTISKPFYESKKIFNWADFGREELFPYRVKLEPVISIEEPVPIDKLVGKLSFTKRLKHWSVFLRRAMLEITKEDFELIKSLLS